MINPIAFFFIFLSYTLGLLFDLTSMLLFNLPVIAIFRGFFILGYYFNYMKHAERDPDEERILIFSKKEKIYFGIKNAVVIFLGFLNIYVALFFALYSIMIAGLYFKNIGERIDSSRFKKIGKLAYGLSPILFLIGFSLFYIFSVVPICFAIIAFLYRGQKYGNYSLKRLAQRYDKRIFRGLPKPLQVFIMWFLIVTPITWGFALSYAYPAREHVWIKMDDGAKLSTDIYYSPSKRDFFGEPIEAPVILIRTPYRKDQLGMEAYAGIYLSQGYHVVFQDMRNTGDSDGEDEDVMFASSYSDGVETIDWILKQDWCNGKIGSTGASALSINSFMYAGMEDAYDGNDGLKCQSQWFGLADMYQDGVIEGALRYDLVVRWIENTAPNNYRYQLDTLFDLINSKDRSDPIYLRTTLKEGENNFENVECASFHVAGFYDVFLGGSVRAYHGYSRNASKNARNKARLLIGPWTHGAVYTGQQGALTYPDNSLGLFDIILTESRLMSEELDGIDTGLWDENPVKYYLMGSLDENPSSTANIWKTADDWPPKYDWNKWYIGEDDDGKDVLVDDSDDLDGFNNFSYKYDPRDPIETIGGNNLGNLNGIAPGPQDQEPILDRKDVEVFTSEELDEPYTITGDIKVRLHFKSNCTDTDFMVRLVDVYPDGRNMLVIDGAKMARLRKSIYEEHFLTPDKEYNMTISLLSFAYQFNEGHRMRLIISSSNYPRYAINPNTGGNITQHYSDGFIAKNGIITGPGKSCIYFPEPK